MMHIIRDRLIDTAVRIADSEELTEQDHEVLQHTRSCLECEKKLGFCLDMLRLMSPEELKESYLEELLRREMMQKKESLAERLLYKIKFVADAVQNQMDYFVERIREGCPRFEAPYELAFARGGTEKSIQLAAELSAIHFDAENGVLSISLDEDMFGENELIAVLEAGGKWLQKEMEPDGYGMLEADFELPENVTDGYVLSIMEKRS